MTAALVIFVAACSGDVDTSPEVAAVLESMDSAERNRVEALRTALRDDPAALAAYDALLTLSQPTAEPIPRAEMRDVGLREPIDAGPGVVLTLDEVRWSGRITLSRAGESYSTYFEPDYDYLVVTYSISNNSTEDIDPEDTFRSFYVEDDLGRQDYGTSLLGIEDYSAQLWGVEIADIVRSGKVGRGVMIFDVARDAPNSVLRSDEHAIIVSLAMVMP